MRIPESLLQEYVAERNFVKPEIIMGNYTLKWDEFAFGIPPREVPELKAFLRDILPYISGAFFKAANELSNTIVKKVGDIKKARKIHDSLSPQLHLSFCKRDYAYALQMRQDGTTIIKRNETVTATEADGRKQTKGGKTFQLDFILGELIFIR